MGGDSDESRLRMILLIDRGGLRLGLLDVSLLFS